MRGRFGDKVLGLFKEQCYVGGVWFRGVQVEGLQYLGRLVVRCWFLKWNCFFIVSVTRLANFRTRWYVEASVETKLRPKQSTSVSMGDSWWEERFLMALFLKFVLSSWRIRRLVFPKFLVVRDCGKFLE